MRSLIVVAVLVLAPRISEANTDSWFTLGVGASVGVSHNSTVVSQRTPSFVGEMSIQVRMLRVLGLEMAWAPLDGLDDRQELAFDTRLRLSLLLHLVPTTPVGVHLKAGLGGGTFADLALLGLRTRSLHGGVGVDVHVSDHFVLVPEFLVLVPGFGDWLAGNGGRKFRFAVCLRYYL